ncbi:MAG: prepilin peptidase [Deltaproteobacteria bacterium]|nr:prepilin peptidase [Deltaproteobacteria bacterium]
MFSPSPAAAAAAMRPGPIAGRYPERNDLESSLLGRSFDALKGKLPRLPLHGQAGLREVAAAIQSEGEPLVALSDEELEKRVADLRRELHGNGLSDPLCIRAFALIRELAERTLGLRHYDSQLMAGWAILQGKLAEMETGEGKTLAATLAAATAALAGIPTHVITANEYLVERDARTMGPLYRALGLSVGAVTQELDPERKRTGYACDIAYATNKQVAFDYLRDRLLLGNNRGPLRLRLESAGGGDRLSRLLLRGLCFAVVDEADSVLIDEARTPLILTREAECGAEKAVYEQTLELARRLEEGRDFLLDRSGREVRLTQEGQRKLAAFRPGGDGLPSQPRHREELVRQALQALHLLHRDRDYLVLEGQILILDPHTGRRMPDRSWGRGLHQLVEAKEACTLTQAREPLGRLTYQRFFRRYLRLGGMTGTAREVGSELWSIYGLRVQPIPLRRPSRRRELPPLVRPGSEEKWVAVVAAIDEIRRQERPVLIGTASVADSELLSGRLTAARIPHRVLNARQDLQEAEIIAAAGNRGQVTVATNMAGRGTDIPLAAGVAELGGLHIVAACLNEAGRIDRQLSGRCARQGDPGSHQFILSLEDELMLRHGPPRLIRWLRRLAGGGGPWQGRLCLLVMRQIQKGVERRHREARRALLQFDRQTGRMLAFSGHLE